MAAENKSDYNITIYPPPPKETITLCKIHYHTTTNIKRFLNLCVCGWQRRRMMKNDRKWKQKFGGRALDFCIECNEFVWVRQWKMLKTFGLQKSNGTDIELMCEREKSNENGKILPNNALNRILAHSCLSCAYFYLFWGEWKTFYMEMCKL